jgi:hypothetical protein
MRARACARCKEYILIIPNDSINEELLKRFEKNHREHTLLTINHSEVKKVYKNIENFET